jgi:hypothetical protein
MTRTGVAVIVGGEFNGPGVCRSRGRSGVSAYLIDKTRLNPRQGSRYARRPEDARRPISPATV